MDPFSLLRSRFEEGEYLRLNPDVREKVEEGCFPSAWDHYRSHGIVQPRPGRPTLPEPWKQVAESPPIATPPPHLRERVHGSDSLGTYTTHGKVTTMTIAAIMEAEGVELPREARVLDFGCGCGRVLGWMPLLFPGAIWSGTDIDPEAIHWCRENLGGIAEFDVNQELPPLNYPSDHFDFVYSISIFTHLPEEMQFAWLRELQRVTKPEGYLFLSTHGPEVFPARSPRERRQFEKAGFRYVADSPATDGLPSFYRTAFHTEAYISRNWSRHLRIHRVIPKGLQQYQDVVLCQPAA